VLAIAVLIGHPGIAQAADPTNFVIFLSDDQGWGDLGSYGHKEIQSPNIDKFAKEGLRFTQCYAASAFCSPSRSAILTGRTPYRNGVFTWIPEGNQVHLRTSEVTAATLLKNAGYDTCHVGKWHLNGKFNSPQQPQPNDHGYQWWLATQNNARPSHKNPRNFVRNGQPAGPLEGYSAVLVAEEAIRWLKEHRDSSKPFFLTVWTHEPHKPIERSPEFMAKYKNMHNEDLRQYCGNISQLDHAFGMLMETLDELKLADDTFVFYTSDNGPEGREQNGQLTGRSRGSTGGLRGRKRDVYEGGIRVPGICRWPGHVQPGTETDTPVVGSDLFSTVLDIAGVEPPKKVIDGVSMRPVFEGKPLSRPIPLYWRCYIAHGPKTAMRIGDWKILADERLTQFELYNIKEDPRETHDLAAREPEKLAEMKEELMALNAEIEAEGPGWWKNYDGKPKRD